MRIAIARTAAEMESLRPAWERLYQAGNHTLFQSFAWNLLAAQVFAGREAPRVVYVESGGGEAIVPACVVGDGRLGLLGETLFDYRDVLASGDPEALRRAWEVLAEDGRALSITAVAGDDIRCRWEGLGFACESFCHAPRTRSADISAAEFKKQHHHPVDQMRRLKRLGASVRVRSGRDSELLREIYRCKAQQQEIRNNLFDDVARVEFGVRAAAMDPGCEVFTVETDSELVSALVTYRDGNIRRLYTTCYDPRWAKCSPGVVLLFEATRRALEQGLDCDFMTGEHPHKTRFTTVRVPLYHVRATAEQLADIGRGRSLELAA